MQEDMPEVLPHVYTSSSMQGNVLSHLGAKYMLPIGTKREYYDVGLLICFRGCVAIESCDTSGLRRGHCTTRQSCSP